MDPSVTGVFGVSILMSIVGMGLFGNMTWDAYHRFRRRPSAKKTWMFMALAALTWAWATLLVTALAGLMGATETLMDWHPAIGHAAMLMRGGLLAFGFALWWGWRKIPDMDGGT